MSQELEKESKNKSLPPTWWHDAIRNNMVGYQVNPQRFETPIMGSENGIMYALSSITAGDPDNYPEGIYIAATLPEGADIQNPDIFIPILHPIRELFKKESRKQNIKPEGFGEQ